MTWRQKLRKIVLIVFPILYLLCWAHIVYDAFIAPDPDTVNRILDVRSAVTLANLPCAAAFVLILVLNANAGVKVNLRAREWQQALLIALAWVILPIFERCYFHLTL